MSHTALGELRKAWDRWRLFEESESSRPSPTTPGESQELYHGLKSAIDALLREAADALARLREAWVVWRRDLPLDMRGHVEPPRIVDTTARNLDAAISALLASAPTLTERHPATVSGSPEQRSLQELSEYCTMRADMCDSRIDPDSRRAAHWKMCAMQLDRLTGGQG